MGQVKNIANCIYTTWGLCRGPCDAVCLDWAEKKTIWREKRASSTHPLLFEESYLLHVTRKPHLLSPSSALEASTLLMFPSAFSGRLNLGPAPDDTVFLAVFSSYRNWESHQTHPGTVKLVVTEQGVCEGDSCVAGSSFWDWWRDSFIREGIVDGQCLSSPSHCVPWHGAW